MIEKFKVYESHNPGKVAITLTLLASALVIFAVWCITPKPTVEEADAKIRDSARYTLKDRYPPSMGSGKVANTKDI